MVLNNFHPKTHNGGRYFSSTCPDAGPKSRICMKVVYFEGYFKK